MRQHIQQGDLGGKVTFDKQKGLWTSSGHVWLWGRGGKCRLLCGAWPEYVRARSRHRKKMNMTNRRAVGAGLEEGGTRHRWPERDGSVGVSRTVRARPLNTGSLKCRVGVALFGCRRK